MKVCSLYGAGFYYIPGTDTCIKIGGYMRTEWNHNAGGSFATSVAGANAQYNRGSDTLVNRTRGLFSFDVRSQTEYGTLRGFVRSGWQWTTNDPFSGIGGSTNVVYLDRIFIQFAGFTFGKTQSFFDVPDIADMTYQTEFNRNNTGGSGTPVLAYTAMLGNGVTTTLSLEDYSERRTAIVDLSQPAFAIGGPNASDNHGNEMPDIVGNLRVDQAWGSAQISGALHNNQAQYYGAPAAPAGQQGHPDEKWGWAVSAGILLKMPWDARDTFAVAATYAEGATIYVWNGSGGAFGGAGGAPAPFTARGRGANLYGAGGVAAGWLDDAYFATGGQLELPKTWNVNAGFQHYWTNSLRSSIWGSYSQYEASSASVDALICAPRGFGAGCADWNALQVGSRTIWNPVTNLDIGLEVMYTKIETAFAGGIAGAGGTVPTNNVIDPSKRINDQDVWSGVLRIQRNFWP